MDSYNHQKEINEAIRAGERARQSLTDACSKLDSAGNWGLLADLLVQSKISDAKQAVDNAIFRVDNILARLRAEQING